MKKYSLKYFIPVAAFCFLYACQKNDGITNQPYSTYGTTDPTKGQLKINLASIYNADLANMLIKINGQVVSNLIQSRTPFPGGGYNTRGSNFAIYLSVPQGANTVSVIVPKVGTSTDSVVLYTGSVTIPDNSPYTLHITDTLVNASTNNTKTVLVKNIINPAVDTGMCRFRLVNLIPNLPAVDFYLNGTLIKANVAYLSATDTVSIRTGANAPNLANFPVPTWHVRPAGAAITTAAIATYANALSLQTQFVMTGFALGYSGVTGTRAPFISFTIDKNQ